MALTPKKKTVASGSEPAIGLDKRARNSAVELVSQALAEAYLLQLKTQNYHWNVTGPYFKPLHELFELQYGQLAEAVDTLAERIRSLGAAAPGTFREFAELSSLPEDKSLPADWQTMVKNLLESHEAVIRNLRGWIVQTEDLDDEGTASLLSDRQREHEKTAWMLRSHLQ